MTDGLRRLFLESALDPALARRWVDDPDGLLDAFEVSLSERRALRSGGPDALALLAELAPQPGPGEVNEAPAAPRVTTFPTLTLGLEVALAGWEPGQAPRWSISLVTGAPRAGFLVELYPWWDGALRLQATLRPADGPSAAPPSTSWDLRPDARLGDALRRDLAAGREPDAAWGDFFDALGAP